MAEGEGSVLRGRKGMKPEDLKGELHGMRRQGNSRKQPWPTTSVILLLRALVVLQCAFLVPWEFGEAVCVPVARCDTAYAFYRIRAGENLTSIGQKFQTTQENIQAVNPSIVDLNFIEAGDPLYIPFSCDCVNDQLLKIFQYQVTGTDSLDSITSITYENLTQNSWVEASNPLADPNTLTSEQFLNIPVNCSCDNPGSSPDHYIFLTYVVLGGTDGNLSGIASDFNTSTDLIKQFNPGVVWDNAQSNQYAFIPLPDKNYVPNGSGSSDSGNSTNTAVIAGAVVAGVVVFFTVLAIVLYYLCVYKPKKQADGLFIKNGRTHSGSASDLLNTGMHSWNYPNLVGDLIILGLTVLFHVIYPLSSSASAKTSSNPGSASFGPAGLADYTVDKSVEFTYEELADATDNFSVVNKIGEGGFAMVFYGVIRGQKLAIKRMNLQATKEFMAELQVLTHVHHTNLVQLIGYCTTDYLFLIYEFVENGTLDHHLHFVKAGKAPLTWSSRVQIALDAARGLEYIHEHTRPSYIHRDIKSANILLDPQFHAKVADFGLTKLTETKIDGHSGTNPTNVVGTWGYMAPEYARFGEVSPMLDVYAFGVVLLEILSGREAIMRGVLTEHEDMSSSTGRPMEEQRALVNYFEPVLKGPNGKDNLPKFMDLALGDNYPSDAAWKMAQLAGACTHDLPSKRPTMRKAVVALMTLSSTTYDWKVSAFANE